MSAVEGQGRERHGGWRTKQNGPQITEARESFETASNSTATRSESHKAEAGNHQGIHAGLRDWAYLEEQGPVQTTGTVGRTIPWVCRTETREYRSDVHIGIATECRKPIAVEVAISNSRLTDINIEQAIARDVRGSTSADESSTRSVECVTLQCKEGRTVACFSDVAGRTARVNGTEVAVGTEPEKDLHATASESGCRRHCSGEVVTVEHERHFATAA
jgi:hypothetical protein